MLIFLEKYDKVEKMKTDKDRSKDAQVFKSCFFYKIKDLHLVSQTYGVKGYC